MTLTSPKKGLDWQLVEHKAARDEEDPETKIRVHKITDIFNT